MDPRQKQLDLPRVLPKGVLKVRPLPDRVAVLEFILSKLLELDWELAPGNISVRLLSLQRVLKGTDATLDREETLGEVGEGPL